MFQLKIEGRWEFHIIHTQDGQIKQNVLNALSACYYDLNDGWWWENMTDIS